MVGADGQVVCKLTLETERLKEWLTATRDDAGAITRILHQCHAIEMQLDKMPRDVRKSLRNEYLEPLTIACEQIIHVASLSATEIKSSLTASGLHANSLPPHGFKGVTTKDELIKLHSTRTSPAIIHIMKGF